MKSIYRPKYILNCWLIKVATFGRYNSWTHTWNRKIESNILQKVLPMSVAEVPINVWHFYIALLSLFCPFHPKPTWWGLSLETVQVTPCFQAYQLVLFSQDSSGKAWTCVLGSYLAVGWIPDQLGSYQRVLPGAAERCGRCFGSGCLSLWKSHQPWIQQNSPRPSHFLLHVWQFKPHTVEASFHLLYTIQRSCLMNWRLQILIHQFIIPFSSLQ